MFNNGDVANDDDDDVSDTPDNVRCLKLLLLFVDKIGVIGF